jgi:hypothetical protein
LFPSFLFSSPLSFLLPSLLFSSCIMLLI